MPRAAARERGPRGGERASFTGAGFRTPSVPVEEGKIYDAQIEDIGREGDGVARIQNFVVFVPGTRVGDKVKVRITKIGRRMAFGEVVKE
jgi:predicted RNA-binding protein with TRAM domain